VLLLYEFRLDRKANEATSNICGMMGKDVLSIRTAQRWFNRFKNGNFELDDLPHPGRPLEVDMDVLQQLIEEDPRLTTRCLAERLGCSQITVETHLRELDKTWKYRVWIPHDLSPHQL
jgi:histone-lysine N-methyltransferase SETMAR